MDATTNGSDSAANGSGSVSYQTVSIELVARPVGGRCKVFSIAAGL